MFFEKVEFKIITSGISKFNLDWRGIFTKSFAFYTCYAKLIYDVYLHVDTYYILYEYTMML